MSTAILSVENTDKIIQRAISILLNGGALAYPTETIYGLGAKYDDEPAVKRLYDLKNRPREKTIPLLVGSVEQLSVLAEYVNDTAADLISRFWPGPLTLILRARDGLSSYITSDGRVAVRIPGESFALQLVRSAGFPITATSANISGRPPARNAGMVASYFSAGLDLIIDGGESQTALPSTIVDVTEETAIVLREGAIKLSQLFVR
jgi:L-threonylcarbamoyladenylate synthase